MERDTFKIVAGIFAGAALGLLLRLAIKGELEPKDELRDVAAGISSSAKADAVDPELPAPWPPCRYEVRPCDPRTHPSAGGLCGRIVCD